MPADGDGTADGLCEKENNLCGKMVSKRDDVRSPLVMSDSGDGTVVLPAELKVGKFAEARVNEILELRKTIGE